MFTVENNKIIRMSYNTFLYNYIDENNEEDKENEDNKYHKDNEYDEEIKINNDYEIIYENNIIPKDRILSNRQIENAIKKFIKIYPEIDIDNIEIDYVYGKYIMTVYKISSDYFDDKYDYYMYAYIKYLYESTLNDIIVNILEKINFSKIEINKMSNILDLYNILHILDKYIQSRYFCGSPLLQLVAYGSQDYLLTGNPEITFFKVTYNR